MPAPTPLEDPKFLEFYVEAKKRTYAANGVAGVNVRRDDGGIGYRFSDERWPSYMYEDIWYGENPFSGREIVYDIGATDENIGIFQPATILSYNGAAVGSEEQIKRLFAFQQQMLRQVSAKRPLRGPKSHPEGNMEYRCDYRILPVPSIHHPQRIIGSEEIVLTGNSWDPRVSCQLQFIFCALR